MVSFAFRTAGQILFGSGESARAPEMAARFGRRILFVTGGSSLERSGALERFQHGLDKAGLEAIRFQVDHEPDTTLADEGAALCRSARCEVVLAIGGGSVIDAAKAISALATHDGKAIDYVAVRSERSSAFGRSVRSASPRRTCRASLQAAAPGACAAIRLS